MLLKVNDLRVFYNRVEAVKGINLAVAEGEFVALIGSNGAGKTSTLNAISGIAQFEGEMLFKGERIDKLAPPKIAAKGIIQVPEGGKLFPLLSVMDNLRMGAYLQRNKREIAARLDRIFDIFPILQERVGQRADSLSGGERQLLATGRALMANPSLLLMDEPSLGLSPLYCQRLEAQIVEISQDGIAIILVEQNARIALRLCSRGYVFEKGKIVLEGNSSDLIKDQEIKRVYLGI